MLVSQLKLPKKNEIADRADLRRSIKKKQSPCSMLMSQLKLPKKNETADLRQS